ncbi:hypothetical protein BGX26_006969 [Mortierella sp. AD094]|nr:hypothetical protein BGX26_006969 [Mortierella sp. AD094]
MAVTTRNRAVPAAKRATAAPKRSAPKRTTKKAPVEPESDEEEGEEEEEDENEDDHEKGHDSDDDAESEAEEEEEEEDAQGESSDEDTFKIHTPKASTEPRIAPAALPTMKYEDDSEDEDSDAAPEAESLSSAKAKVLNAQDKEKTFLSKIQAEQKAKRVEREEKLKAQKDQSKKKTQSTKAQAQKDDETEEKEAPKSTTKSGLPTMLPMDLLESVAKMEDSNQSSASTTNDKKRKHMRPEDFALMELEAELKAEAQKRKKAEKTQKTVGPVTVKVLDQSQLAKGHAIPETIVDFRKQHFFGSKIQRKDAVLNLSQRNLGAASKFGRRK